MKPTKTFKREMGFKVNLIGQLSLFILQHHNLRNYSQHLFRSHHLNLRLGFGTTKMNANFPVEVNKVKESLETNSSPDNNLTRVPIEQIKSKKGYYSGEPSPHVGCSVCSAEPENNDQIVDDNWETCHGRDMFFCPDHRVQYPCHNKDCEADMCSNFHSLDEEIEDWDYETEAYE